LKGQFATTNDGLPFLLYDSRVQNPDDPIFFVFASPAGMERLRTFNEWSGDGTFKGGIILFYHL
jgi:hypothetical protein